PTLVDPLSLLAALPICAAPVALPQVADDHVRLVHRRAGVRIHEPGELLLAAPLAHLGPEARPPLRTGPHVGFEVEGRQHLAHLAAVGAAFELVELDGLLRAGARRLHAQTAAEPARARGERGGDVEDAVHGPSSGRPRSVAPARAAPGGAGRGSAPARGA